MRAREELSALFFGCWERAGHYAWAPGMRRSAKGCPLDDGFLDNAGHRLRPSDPPLLQQFKGWTTISFCDNSVDTRPGSHATFAFIGLLTYIECIELARTLFPEVCERVSAQHPVLRLLERLQVARRATAAEVLRAGLLALS
jgi:hypothetical protein